MNEKKWIVAGIVVFLVVSTFPFWFNVGKAAPPPVIELSAKAKEAKECVQPLAYMKANHMQVLDLWRHSVVRNATRTYVNGSGKEFNMSLSNTCLDCHSNKAEFCDRCHTYASVRPYCWDCHNENPKEKQ